MAKKHEKTASIGTSSIWLSGVEVKPSTNELIVDGEKLRIKPKVMQVLVKLVESQGEVVTKADLLDAIWPNMAVSDSALTEAIHELRRALDDSASQPRFIQTIPRKGYRIVAEIQTSLPEVSKSATRPRVVVTRFRSLGAEPEDEYLSEGLCEELTNTLGCIRQIDVLARPSVWDTSSGVDVSQNLGATHVVSGTLRRKGDRVRVIARLSRTDTDVQVWSEAYDETLEDILDLQNDIASRIGVALAPQFETDGGPAVRPRHKPDPEAFREFSKGRYFWKLDNANPQRAMTHYETALRIDPAYAAPYAGMVECFNTLGVFHLMQPMSEVRDASLRYSEQALFLDPDSPDGLFAFGYTQFYMRWNWAGAEAAFLKCLSIKPNHAIAHSFLSLLYSVLGRHDESLQHTNAAKRLDPFSTLTWWLAFLHYHYAREYELGLETARRGLELHPDDILINWAIADSLVRLGRNREALEAVERLYQLTAEFPLYRVCSAILFSILGKSDITRQVQSDLGLDADKVDDPFISGLIAIYVDQPERALAMFESAEQHRDPLIWVLSCEPYFDPIRGEQRFRDLLSRLELPADDLPIKH